MEFVDSNANFNAVKNTEVATGVKLRFEEVSSESAKTQFSLMVAGGDMTDLIPASSYYDGGLSKAYEEEIIMDIEPFLEEYMPNYSAVLQNIDANVAKQTKTEGMTLAFQSIADGSFTNQSLVTRGDWLKEQNITFSGDIIPLKEFTDLLYQLHNAYDTPNTYYMTSDGIVYSMEAAFDTRIPALADSFMISMNTTVFRYGNKCVSAWTTDGYRDYLEWLLQLMKDGVIYQDFLSLDTNTGVMNTANGTGKTAVWSAGADKIDEVTYYADEANAGIQAEPMPRIADPSEPFVWNEETTLITPGFSVSATCKQPELVCQWMNYFWTTDGYLMANYGVEGESLKFEDGEPVFDWETPQTVLGMNAPNADMALELFTMKRFASFYQDHDRLVTTFSDNGIRAVELWTVENGVDDRYYPSTLKNGFTMDETAKIAEYEPDMITYAQETVLKFLDGSLALNDSSWNEYVETCNSMGVEEIVAVYQNAYDEYLAGER